MYEGSWRIGNFKDLRLFHRSVELIIINNPRYIYRVVVSILLIALLNPRVATGEETSDKIYNGLISTDQRIREETAREILTKKDLAALGPLLKALDNPRVDVRRNAIFLLGTLGDQRATAALMNAFRDKNELIRAKAAEALGKIGGPSVLDPMLRNLEDQDPAVRKTAAWALGFFKDKRVIGPLVGAFKDRDSQVARGGGPGFGKGRS